MGLLNFIEHPIQGLQGLLGYQQPQGDFGPSYAAPDQPQPPPMPQPQSIPRQLFNGVTAFPRALGGAIMNDLQSGPQATALANQIRQQIASTPMDPRERAVAMANPGEWAKQNATRFGYHGVSPGETALYGQPGATGSARYVAPITHAFDDRFGTYDPNSGNTTFGEARPMTEAEITARQKAQSDAAAGKVVGAGGALIDPSGKVIYQAPFAPRLQAVDPTKDLYQMGGPPTNGPSTSSQMLAMLPQGSRVTSTARSPAHNAAVGGVADSHHLNDTAIDFIPPPGVSIDQVKQQYAAQGVRLTEALDEGDHFHIAWGAPPAAAAPRLVKKGVPAPNAGGGLNDQAVENLAQQYAAGDKSVITSLGRNGAGNADRTRVLNRSVEIMAGQGLTGGDTVANRAAMESNKAALKKITSTRDQIKASEDTVAANMQLVIGLAPKGGGPTPSPLLNTPIQYARKNVWGSADVSAFDNAIGTVADEYAKVMTTTTGAGGGVSSDSARKEAYSRLSKSANFGQLQNNIVTMQKEMDNRVDAFNKQEDAILNRIKGQGQPAPAAAPSAPPQKRYSPQEAAKLPKGTQFMTTDGRVLVRQ